jgi:hypothetical protein
MPARQIAEPLFLRLLETSQVTALSVLVGRTARYISGGFGFAAATMNCW